MPKAKPKSTSLSRPRSTGIGLGTRSGTLESVLEEVGNRLKRGEDVRLVGFGTYSLQGRKTPGDAVRVIDHSDSYTPIEYIEYSVDVAPEGETIIRAKGPAGDPNDVAKSGPLAAAQARGRDRVAQILSRGDMMSADEMAKMLGTTRMTVNAKRRAHQLLGLEGAKRGVRYPQWQIGENGKPFEALPALFERLGGSPWAVYRFLVQRHAELGGLTGREALAKGRTAEAIEASESVAGAYS